MLKDAEIIWEGWYKGCYTIIWKCKRCGLRKMTTATMVKGLPDWRSKGIAHANAGMNVGHHIRNNHHYNEEKQKNIDKCIEEILAAVKLGTTGGDQ